MRIIFAGTPDFSVPALNSLINAGHELICVYTQPDKKTGRGQKILPPPVKQCALEHNIPVKQPISLKTPEAAQEIRQLSPDVMVVVAYGMLLPQEILDIPRLGCLNIHASLLPKWRGAAPIQRSLEAGDEQTGICIMQMELGLDTGPVLSEVRTDINQDDTSASLHDRLAEQGAHALTQVLPALEAGTITAVSQDHDNSTYAQKITKSEALIDWSQSAKSIDCQIRAFNPWPICQTTLEQKRIRIWFSTFAHNEESQKLHNAAPGTIISADNNGIQVACGQGSIFIKRLQRDGGKPLECGEFLNGQKLVAGQQFV